MKTVMNLLMACAVLGTMSATAMAGGGGNGGAKDDGTVEVKNNFAGRVMAVVVGNDDIDSVSDFLAQGAQFVQPGDTASFSVAAGDQTVTALFIADVAPFTVLGPVQADVDVEKNETSHISGNAPGILIED